MSTTLLRAIVWLSGATGHLAFTRVTYYKYSEKIGASHIFIQINFTVLQTKLAMRQLGNYPTSAPQLWGIFYTKQRLRLTQSKKNKCNPSLMPCECVTPTASPVSHKKLRSHTPGSDPKVMKLRHSNQFRQNPRKQVMHQPSPKRKLSVLPSVFPRIKRRHLGPHRRRHLL